MDAQIGGWFKQMHMEYNQANLNQMHQKDAHNIYMVCNIN